MNRVLDEYANVVDSEFWKTYIKNITNLRDSQVKQLESAPLEKISRIQGGISSIDLILGLPERIIRSITDKPTQ